MQIELELDNIVHTLKCVCDVWSTNSTMKLAISLVIYFVTRKTHLRGNPHIFLISGVLSFPTVSSSLLTSTGSFKTSVSVQNEADSISNCQNTPSEPCKEKTQSSGGLVTGAPSPPDLKESLGKPQNTTDLSKISKSLVLENKDDKLVGQRDASSISSPESTSSSREDEAMVIDQSPPVKVINIQNQQ